MKKLLICSALFLMPLCQAAEGDRNAMSGMTENLGHVRHDKMHGMGQPVSWTTYPTLKMRSSGENREKMVVTVMAKNIVPDQIDAYSNNLKDKTGHRILPIEMAGAVLDKPSTGGFHWLTAREVQGDLIKVASTVNFFSNPGKNPTVMFMQHKNELEVIPQPYPREHSRYRANEDWPFLVRFNGQPLAAQKMTLETSNGSRVELTSDLQGLVKLRLPDDFKAEDDKAEKGQQHHGRKSGDFVLATEHVAAGKTYLTAFNSSYGPDAFDGRSLAWGLGFTLLGMAGATPLLRQRVKKSAAPATKSTES